jgi:hypothetical protein
MIPEPVIDWLNGVGTPEEPFQIENAEQLFLLHKSSLLWNKHFILNADIDLDPNLPGRVVLEQAVIPTFEGSFVGNGHVIINLQIEGRGYLGLFGYVKAENAEIRDLGLIDPNIDAGTGDYVGSLVGYLRDGAITNCYVEGGSVSGYGDVGGLVGYNWAGDVTDCYSTGVVGGGYDVGGLVGDNHGNILNCYSTGTISGYRYVGGLVGSNHGNILNCYSNGPVSGKNRVGGLVGDNNRYVTNCYSTSPVCGSGWGVGGLVGNGNPDGVTHCFWDTQTSGQITSAGGMGKTTAEMQMAETFLEAGWDFVDEMENGIEDIWLIFEGHDYPSLKDLPEDPRLLFYLSFCPKPHNGAIDVIHSQVLHWAPANPAMQHDIYLGESKQAVANATTLSLGTYRGRQPGDVTSFDPGILEWGKTYYWRIDEYYTDAIISKGYVWNFTTANFIVVDDFESYNDLDESDPDSNRIYLTWVDGFDNPAINGSIVGDLVGWTAQTIVHGGNQSMPFSYDNAVGTSEATANIVNLEISRDWTENGVDTLSIWYRGISSNAAETMYVALANDNGTTGVSYHGNPDVVLIDDWTEWRINLQEFADQGVDLTNINTISIGFGNRSNPVAGGSGRIWFDDIRLYRLIPEP